MKTKLAFLLVVLLAFPAIAMAQLQPPAAPDSGSSFPAEKMIMETACLLGTEEYAITITKGFVTAAKHIKSGTVISFAVNSQLKPIYRINNGYASIIRSSEAVARRIQKFCGAVK